MKVKDCYFNSFLACGDICHPLITCTSSMDSDQNQQNVSPTLGTNPFHTLIVFLKEFFLKKVEFEIHLQTTKIMKNYPTIKVKRIICYYIGLRPGPNSK